MVVLVIRNDLLLGIIYAISGICLISYRIVVVVKSFTNCLFRDFCKYDSLRVFTQITMWYWARFFLQRVEALILYYCQIP